MTAGADHSCAIKKTDNSVKGWGSSNVDHGFEDCITTPSDLGPVSQISAGTDYMVAIRSDGTIQGWGSFPLPPTFFCFSSSYSHFS
ncbi:MAG: hypothetical protein KA436_07345 [Oligoflexales bacterium]|nr:hypothetical protein [Oligoflexales bacterium]